jgi:hypothetical protein
MRHLLDSLGQRILFLEKEIPRLSETRATNYFFVKRELDFTVFLKHYHLYIYDEELDKAKDLVESRLKSAQKRGDKTAEDFYRGYRKEITSEISDQQRRYRKLFEDEKTFRKEFYRFVNKGDEYSLKRAQRMTDLALKYALENKIVSAYGFLHEYKSYIYSLLYDYYSEYDLEKLTRSEPAFQKTFLPLVESGDLELIEEAGKLVDNCYTYSLTRSSGLDTLFFARQKQVVASYISDYYDKNGPHYAAVEFRETTATVARLDTLLKDGIYKWRNNIVVVGHFKPEAMNRNVRKGEAILSADKKLVKYIRLNKLAKWSRELKMGQTFLIPYISNEQVVEFMYNPGHRKYQYIVCYTKVENEYFTQRLGQYLPPLQFGNIK